MAIIYSYPLSTPTTKDLLIGTVTYDENVIGSPRNKPTVSFSLQSIVDLIAPITGAQNLQQVTNVGATTTNTVTISNLIVSGKIDAVGPFEDSTGSVGSTGQFLESTVTGTRWATNSSNNYWSITQDPWLKPGYVSNWTKLITNNLSEGIIVKTPSQVPGIVDPNLLNGIYQSGIFNGSPSGGGIFMSYRGNLASSCEALYYKNNAFLQPAGALTIRTTIDDSSPVTLALITPGSGFSNNGEYETTVSPAGGTGLQVIMYVSNTPPGNTIPYALAPRWRGRGYSDGDVITVIGGNGNCTATVTVSKGSTQINQGPVIAFCGQNHQQPYNQQQQDEDHIPLGRIGGFAERTFTADFNTPGYLLFQTSSFYNGKSSLADRMKISSTGQIRFNAYGSASFTGTPTFNLSTTSSGNVIETPLYTWIARDSGDADKTLSVGQYLKFVTATGTLGTALTGTGTTSDPYLMTLTSPDTNTQNTYTAGTGLGLSSFEFSANVDTTAQTVQPVAVTDTALRTYAVQVDDTNDNLVVNVPWTGLSYTLPAATVAALGGVRLFNDTVNDVAPETITTTANRNYVVELSTDHKMLVNVPWTDTTGVTGSGADTQITIWDSATSITGNSNYTRDASNNISQGADTDVKNTIGRAVVDGGTINSDFAIFTHVDRVGSLDYAFMVSPNGSSYINAAGAGQTVQILDDNSSVASFNNDLVQIGGTNVQLTQYGSGTVTGTPTYNLSVDSTGKIIETANSSGGGGLVSKIATNSFSATQLQTGGTLSFQLPNSVPVGKQLLIQDCVFYLDAGSVSFNYGTGVGSIIELKFNDGSTFSQSLALASTQSFMNGSSDNMQQGSQPGLNPPIVSFPVLYGDIVTTGGGTMQIVLPSISGIAPTQGNGELYCSIKYIEVDTGINFGL